MAVPPATATAHEKLLLLLIFLTGTFMLAFTIGRFYSIPLNRWIRQKAKTSQ